MPASPATPDSALVRALGVWGLAASIVNVTVGGGIFRLPGAAAAALGAAAPVAYAVCTVAMGLIVLCFADAGSRVSMTGGPYAYVEVAFGPLVGFLAGALLWVGVTLAFAAVSSFLGDSFAALAPALGRLGSRTAVFVVLVGLAVANTLGVRGAARLNTVATVAKLVPLVLLVAAGVFAMRAEHLRWEAAPSAGAVSRASLLIIFAFLGVESALVPSGEVRDPPRTVPRAIFLAIGAVALLYMVVQVVTQGVLGPALAGDPTPLASAARVALGAWGGTLILVGSAVSMFGYVSGMTLALPRMLFAFARDGFLPPVLAAVHSRWRTPHVAIAAQTALVTYLVFFVRFEALALAANVSALLVYAACCVASVELRRRDVRSDGVPFRVPAGRVVPWLALAVIAGLLSSVTATEWLAAAVVVASAAALYLVTLPARRARAAAAAAADAPAASA